MTPRLKYLLFIFLLIGYAIESIALSDKALSSNKPPNQNQCSLKFAWFDGWAPFITEEKGQLSGHQVELLNWIAEEMQCDIKFINALWSESVEQLKNGSIDIIGRASKSEARKTFAWFSRPYRESVAVLYIRRGEKSRFNQKTLDELLKKNFKLGLVEGGYYGEYVKSLIANPKLTNNISFYSSQITLLEALENNSIDCLFETPFLVDNAVPEKNYFAKFEEYPMEIITGEVHFMLSKKSISADFVAQFNDAMAKVKNSDKYKNHRYWSNH